MAAKSIFSWLTGNKMKSRHAGKKRQSARRSRLAVESLEKRLALATVIINATADNPDQWTISGDNDDNDHALFGTPFTAGIITPLASQGIFDQIAEFDFAGDVRIPSDTEIIGSSDKPISLVFGDNLTIGYLVDFRFEAQGTMPGPGGGAGGPAQTTVGAGAIGGEATPGPGGAGGQGANGLFFAITSGGQQGSEGSFVELGNEGDSGWAGNAGMAGAFASVVGNGNGGDFGSSGTNSFEDDRAQGGEGAGETVDKDGQKGAEGLSFQGGDAPPAPGGEGGMNVALHSWIITGGSGGGSGGSGGGGGSGTGGSTGGGGGGGGPGVGFAGIYTDGGDGGAGGAGGQGRAGGAGGPGGGGGGGGGALEIQVYGRLTFEDGPNDYDQLFSVGGGDGVLGVSGDPSAPLLPVNEGQDGDPGQDFHNNSGKGGDGGRGGDGGAGGQGGTGGIGGGGAGGTAKIVASVVDGRMGGGVVVDVRGGSRELSQQDRGPVHLLTHDYHDLSGAVNHNNSAAVPLMSEHFLGGETNRGPFSGFEIQRVSPGWENGPSTLTVKYYNGRDWVPVGNLNDGTSKDGQTLAQEGCVTWDLPSDWHNNVVGNSPDLWVQITQSNPQNQTIIDEARLIYPTRGGNGRALLGYNAFTGSGSMTVDTGAAEYKTLGSTFDGPTNVNPFINNNTETPLLPDLVGGAEAFGVSKVLTKGNLSSYLQVVPDDARLALLRFDTGPVGYNIEFPGYDLVLLVNLTDQNVARSVNLGIDMNDSQSWSPLMQGGWTNNPQFTPGAPGLQELENLPGGAVYATLVPEGEGDHSFGVFLSTASRIYLKTGNIPDDGGVLYLTGNDAPIVEAINLTTNEDTPLSFTVSATDRDGDLLAFGPIRVLSGEGSFTGGGPFAYIPPANWSGTVQATGVVSDGFTNESFTINIDVTPVADAPNLSIGTIRAEQGNFRLPISVSLNDTDGSEFVFVKVRGLPAEDILADADGNLRGAKLAGGEWVVGEELLDDLRIVHNGQAKDFDLIIEAIATERANHDTASTSQNITIDVQEAMASTPSVSFPIGARSGKESDAIPLALSAVPGDDTDGSETVTLHSTVLIVRLAGGDTGDKEIIGGADDVIFSHGVKQLDGSWIIDAAEISNLAVTYPNGTVIVRLQHILRSTESFNGATADDVVLQTVIVDNVAPILKIDENDSILKEGDTFVRAGSFIDPGVEIWTATVNYGDGSGPQPLALNGKEFELNHTYSQDGDYTVTVNVNDDRAMDTVDFQVTVQNVAPIVAGFTKDGAEDNTLSFSTADFTANFSDPGADSLVGVRIESLPTNGKLYLGSDAVLGGQVIASANLDLLKFVPDLNFNGTVEFYYSATDGTDSSNLATITLNIRSAQQQTVDLSARVDELGGLSQGQRDSLKLNLKDNNGDAAKVQAFLNELNGLLLGNVLDQDEADELRQFGNALLLSINRR